MALFSAALFGVVTALEKRLIGQHLPNLRVYYAEITYSLLIADAVVFFATGVTPERASAILHTFPVFVAILAVFTLGKSLVPSQWAAIFAIVVGAFVISIKRHGERGGLRFSHALPILVVASLLTALSHIFAKAALDDGLTVWMTYAIRSTAMAMAFGVLAKPNGFIEMLGLIRDGHTLALMLVADFSMAPIASISLTRATEMGSISLVAALAATRPFFVLLVSSVFRYNY